MPFWKLWRSALLPPLPMSYSNCCWTSFQIKSSVACKSRNTNHTTKVKTLHYKVWFPRKVILICLPESHTLCAVNSVSPCHCEIPIENWFWEYHLYLGTLSALMGVNNETWTQIASREQVITKTCLFKYTENFTTKKWKFSDKKKIWYFLYFCAKHILWVLVRTASPRRF